MPKFTFIRMILQQRRFRKMLVLLLWISLILGLLVVPVERQNPQAIIRTYFDGIWWATSTVTTVGYGDYVPITTGGKVIGIALQIIGALMFGAMIAMVGMAVDKSQAEFHWKRTSDRFDTLEEMIRRIEKGNNYLVKREDKEEEEEERESKS